jgi:uncharacterized membrane protein AbrB (regulator of aidB expression)
MTIFTMKLQINRKKSRVRMIQVIRIVILQMIAVILTHLHLTMNQVRRKSQRKRRRLRK